MSGKVLVVDDTAALVDLSLSLLAGLGYTVFGTTDIPEAIAAFRGFQPDVCLLDYHMPQMSGGDLAKVFKGQDDRVEIIFLTGADETQLAVDLMKRGAIDYLIKPVEGRRLCASIERALDHRRLVLENASYRNHLEVMVAQQTESIRATLREMERLSAATLDTLGMALDYRDRSTSGHSRRVMMQTAAIARRIGISGNKLLNIENGAFLHDIGKLMIPDSVLLKPAKLLPEEWELMRRHTEYGRDFLLKIDFLAEAAELVYTHHEKYDGSGYPRGLHGEEIPAGSRIFTIVDAIDAMTSARPYNKPIPLEQALEEVQRCSGAHFDPELARVAVDNPSLFLLGR